MYIKITGAIYYGLILQKGSQKKLTPSSKYKQRNNYQSLSTLEVF